jgi:hypothetical protein
LPLRSCFRHFLTPARILFVAGFAATVAFDVEFEDRRVMHELVDGGDRHARVREDVVPAGERLVGRDIRRLRRSYRSAISSNSTLVSAWSFLTYDRSIEDDQVEAVESGECRRQLQALTCHLKLLHDLAGTRVQDAISGVDQRVSDGAPKMTFAFAR